MDTFEKFRNCLHQKKAAPSRSQVPSKLSAHNAVVDILGHAMIPEGTVEILDNAFRSRKDLRWVMLPASVRTVGAFAFAQCPNLRKVKLNDGLEKMGSCVFYECRAIQSLDLPDSLSETVAGTFDGLSISTPLFDRTKSVLYRYFGHPSKLHYTVPATVKRLAAGAFSDDAPLQTLELPPQLKTIDSFAFFSSKVRQVTLPASLKEIGKQAFWRCEELQQLDVYCARHILPAEMLYNCGAVEIELDGEPADYELQLNLHGMDLLTRASNITLPSEAFWEEPSFAELAAQCAKGSARAMLDLAEAYAARDSSDFCACVANFWRYRACQYGNPLAEAWKKQWFVRHPRMQIPSAVASDLRGDYLGRLLRAMGFGFFDPTRFYHLYGVDRNGLVEVSSWCDEDGPDEDGFGREAYYDWWLLDEYLREIPGIEVIHNFSHHERREFHKRFDARYEKARNAVANRESGR